MCNAVLMNVNFEEWVKYEKNYGENGWICKFVYFSVSYGEIVCFLVQGPGVIQVLS